MIEGPDKGVTETFSEGSLTVGRGKGQIPLSDKKVSGQHCRFFIEADQLFVEDTGSTNGTFIRGRKIEAKTQLENLDQVIVGLTKISVAIVDELQDFKAQNKSQTGPLDLDDLSGDEDLVMGSLLEESENSLFTHTKTARASEASVAQLISDDKTRKASPSELAPQPTLDVPDKDAVYRDTGIHRIENLIKDEMETFSKWDHPSVGKSQEKATSIPKVKVTLTSRRGPDGIGQIDCTQASTSFGRKDVDVRLNDLDVSRKHAAVEIVGGKKAFVRDLASTNGTYVNGKKVSYQELNTGDLIQIGQTIFEVAIEGAE